MSPEQWLVTELYKLKIQICLVPTIHHQLPADQTVLALLLLEGGAGLANVAFDADSAPNEEQAKEYCQFTRHTVTVNLQDSIDIGTLVRIILN